MTQRIFIDTCVCQTIYGSQQFVFGGDPHGEDHLPRRKALGAIDRDLIEAHGINELDALRNIMTADYTANNTYVLSKNSLDEIEGHPESRYHRDVFDRYVLPRDFDLLPHSRWGRENAELVEEDKFLYLSMDDKQVIQDALRLECGIFLTLDRGVLSNREHLNRELPIEVQSPLNYWRNLSDHFERAQPV